MVNHEMHTEEARNTVIVLLSQALKETRRYCMGFCLSLVLAATGCVLLNPKGWWPSGAGLSAVFLIVAGLVAWMGFRAKASRCPVINALRKAPETIQHVKHTTTAAAVFPPFHWLIFDIDGVTRPRAIKIKVRTLVKLRKLLPEALPRIEIAIPSAH